MESKKIWIRWESVFIIRIIDLDLKIISKFNQCHQSPIKSISFVPMNFIGFDSYLIAGSYDQVVSIMKIFNDSSNDKISFEIKKIFINAYNYYAVFYDNQDQFNFIVFENLH